MLTDRIKQISEATAQVKQDIADAITAQAPPKRGKWFTIMFSEIEDSILSAAYYDTGHQLHTLAEYATASTERSLPTILNTFNAVVNTGRTAAIPSITVFNSKTRGILRGLL